MRPNTVSPIRSGRAGWSSRARTTTLRVAESSVTATDCTVPWPSASPPAFAPATSDTLSPGWTRAARSGERESTMSNADGSATSTIDCPGSTDCAERSAEARHDAGDRRAQRGERLVALGGEQRAPRLRQIGGRGLGILARRDALVGEPRGAVEGRLSGRDRGLRARDGGIERRMVELDERCARADPLAHGHIDAVDARRRGSRQRGERPRTRCDRADRIDGLDEWLLGGERGACADDGRRTRAGIIGGIGAVAAGRPDTHERTRIRNRRITAPCWLRSPDGAPRRRPRRRRRRRRTGATCRARCAAPPTR